MKLSLVALLHILTSVTSLELDCYDCTPTSQNNCISPEKHNVTRKVCQESNDLPDGMKEETSDSNDNKFECYSLYFETDSEKRGMYRGCVQKYEEYLTACDYLRDNINEGYVEGCKTCTTSGCNVDNFEIVIPNTMRAVRASAVLLAPPSTMAILSFVLFSLKKCALFYQ
jgi:hypothetical protein